MLCTARRAMGTYQGSIAWMPGDSGNDSKEQSLVCQSSAVSLLYWHPVAIWSFSQGSYLVSAMGKNGGV